MREKLLIVLLVVAATVVEGFSSAEAQDLAAKAQQLLAQARAAIGGEKLKSVNSLSATANYRRMLGEREMSGEVQIDLLLPDKMMRTEVMTPMPSLEITRIEAISGNRYWSDQQQSGGGGAMVMIRRPGGETPEGQARQQQAARAEFARLAIGWLLSTPASFPVEYSYLGTAEAPDGKADVIEIKGPDGFTSKLFLDQKTHQPLMLSYAGRKPRIVMNTRMTGHGSPEEMEKRVKEAEAEAAKQPEVEFQVRYSDYRDVSGISLPHRLNRAVDGEVNEEWEVTKFKVNPALKAEKFEKK